MPSVVLGYLAGIVLAPILADLVPATLVSFLTIPIAFMFGGYIWQLMPRHKQIALSQVRFFIMVPFLFMGLIAAYIVGPIAESLFFYINTADGTEGNIVLWLSGNPGASGVGGWLLPFIPAGLFLAFWIKARYISPVMSAKGSVTPTSEFVSFLVTLSAGAVIGLSLAYLVGGIIGIDPRGAANPDTDMLGSYGSYIGTYVSRNALLVGMVMGFAVIPIIYTISEDALSTVPSNLRAASLGAGATVWQTAVRIVIPTAASGLFSATMVGLGRAVGETMIVLMAAGNTALKDLSMFNGFRTLAANIAVELPEAAQGDTHYRILFLSALILFVMTFILNTLAEIVRQRFRKRAVAL